MTCANHPGEGKDVQDGVCHVCAMAKDLPAVLAIFAGKKGRSAQEVRFCSACCHWMCRHCWDRVMGRIEAFVREFVRPSKNCCGPEAK